MFYMLKKILSVVLIILSFNLLPGTTFAYTVYQVTGSSPVGNPTLSANEYHQFFNSGNAYRIVIGSYANSTFSSPISEKTFYRPSGVNAVEEIIFKCNRYYQAKFFNESGVQTGLVQFQSTGLTEPGLCDSGTNYVDQPTGNSGDSGCIGCDLFNCPGWDEYMAKIDEIKNKIPPAPNWDEVAGKIRDAIVPRLVQDLENMLGPAPAQPTPPPQLPKIDDRGISTKVPQMQDVPGLKDSGFNSGDIKTDSPQIEFREDPTGGFDLISDPINSLPDFPTDAFPKPGSTNAGEWGKNKPTGTTNTFPTAPIDIGDPGTGGAPIPKSSGGDTGNTPPSPGDDLGAAPTPGGGSSGGTDPSTGMKDYKPTPSSPDGSGGEFNP
jgi:hypothetical protein